MKIAVEDIFLKCMLNILKIGWKNENLMNVRAHIRALK